MRWTHTCWVHKSTQETTRTISCPLMDCLLLNKCPIELFEHDNTGVQRFHTIEHVQYSHVPMLRQPEQIRRQYSGDVLYFHPMIKQKKWLEKWVIEAILALLDLRSVDNDRLNSYIRISLRPSACMQWGLCCKFAVCHYCTAYIQVSPCNCISIWRQLHNEYDTHRGV